MFVPFLILFDCSKRQTDWQRDIHPSMRSLFDLCIVCMCPIHSMLYLARLMPMKSLLLTSNHQHVRCHTGPGRTWGSKCTVQHHASMELQCVICNVRHGLAPTVFTHSHLHRTRHTYGRIAFFSAGCMLCS